MIDVKDIVLIKTTSIEDVNMIKKLLDCLNLNYQITPDENYIVEKP